MSKGWFTLPGVLFVSAAGLCAVGPLKQTHSGACAAADVALLDYSEPGSAFGAVVIAPVKRAGRVLMPQGSTISGTVTARQAVGLGLLNERASLSIDFHDYSLPDRQPFSAPARLKGIDNAHEEVMADGRIQGVLAADSLQEITGGVWTRPS